MNSQTPTFKQSHSIVDVTNIRFSFGQHSSVIGDNTVIKDGEKYYIIANGWKGREISREEAEG